MMHKALFKSFVHKKQRLDYELLDWGEGWKIERFGMYKLMRPESGFLNKKPKQRIEDWKPDAVCQYLGRNRFVWEPCLQPWKISYEDLVIELRLSHSQNLGVFPEQEANWVWLDSRVQKGQKILNLFAYTGMASLVCARRGASITHVDASRAVVHWASDNARLNGLEDRVRWIVEDALVFLKREHNRGNIYDGLILDPPPFGKSGNRNFKLERDYLELLKKSKLVLKQEGFFLFNNYAMNLSAGKLKQMIRAEFIDKNLEVGSLKLKDLVLSCYARF